MDSIEIEDDHVTSVVRQLESQSFSVKRAKDEGLH